MTTMDQIHRIRELYYEQDKNLNEIAIIMGYSPKIRRYGGFQLSTAYTDISRGARIQA